MAQADPIQSDDPGIEVSVQRLDSLLQDFLTNYLAMYILAVVVPLGLVLVARFEERELLDRFGEAYADYRRRVPTIIPRFGTD